MKATPEIVQQDSEDQSPNFSGIAILLAGASIVWLGVFTMIIAGCH